MDTSIAIYTTIYLAVRLAILSVLAYAFYCVLCPAPSTAKVTTDTPVR
jgi:hypothetical protein